MAAPPARRRYGHVAAWIRLRVPEPAPVVVLMGKPPPPGPPLELLQPDPVMTDPRKRIYSFEEEWGSGLIRMKWDADMPEVLEAEYRMTERRRVPPQEVRSFWAEVKKHTSELGPLPVDGADPVP